NTTLSRTMKIRVIHTIMLAVLAVAPSASGQSTNQPTNATARFRGPQGPQFKSPEVMADRRVAFRILASKAETVRLAAGDIQGLGQNTQLKKETNGVWEIIVGPVDPGAYRYNFSVDGVAVIDPRNPT